MSSVAQQAKNGFKTFLLTFFGSLLVFGAFYYLITDSSAEGISIEDPNGSIGYTKTADTPDDDVQGVSDSTVEGSVSSPFGELAAQEVNETKGRVLAGADTTQSTQSTVPATGVGSITAGLVASVLLFAFFTYIVFLNPRKYALTKFEEGVVKDLD